MTKVKSELTAMCSAEEFPSSGNSAIQSELGNANNNAVAASPTRSSVVSCRSSAVSTHSSGSRLSVTSARSGVSLNCGVEPRATRTSLLREARSCAGRRSPSSQRSSTSNSPVRRSPITTSKTFKSAHENVTNTDVLLNVYSYGNSSPRTLTAVEQGNIAVMDCNPHSSFTQMTTPSPLSPRGEKSARPTSQGVPWPAASHSQRPQSQRAPWPAASNKEGILSSIWSGGDASTHATPRSPTYAEELHQQDTHWAEVPTTVHHTPPAPCFNVNSLREGVQPHADNSSLFAVTTRRNVKEKELSLHQEIYQLTQDHWRKVTELPFKSGVHSWTTISHSHQLTLIGGASINQLAETTDRLVTSVVWQYNTISTRWRRLADLSQGRAWSAVGSRHGELVVIGGATALAPPDLYGAQQIRGMTATCETYLESSDEWESVASYPHEVCAAAACCFDRKIYVCGGWQLDGTAARDFYRLSASGKKWTQLPDMYIGKAEHTMCTTESNIFTFDRDANIEVYKTEEGQWTVLTRGPLLATPLSGVVLRDDRVISFSHALDQLPRGLSWYPHENLTQNLPEVPFKPYTFSLLWIQKSEAHRGDESYDIDTNLAIEQWRAGL